MSSSPLNLVILNDETLLQHLDSIQITRRLLLGQHDLSEVSFTQHRQKVEVVQTDFSLSCDLLLSRGSCLLQLVLNRLMSPRWFWSRWRRHRLGRHLYRWHLSVRILGPRGIIAETILRGRRLLRHRSLTSRAHAIVILLCHVRRLRSGREL